MVFRYKVLSLFIIHQDLSFGGFALKIEFVVFVYKLINYLFMKLFLNQAHAWFLRIASVRELLYVCVFVCVCPPPRLSITSVI